MSCYHVVAAESWISAARNDDDDNDGVDSGQGAERTRMFRPASNSNSRGKSANGYYLESVRMVDAWLLLLMVLTETCDLSPGPCSSARCICALGLVNGA